MNIKCLHINIVLCLLMCPIISFAQTAQNSLSADTVKTLRIPVEEILTSSLQTDIRLDKLSESIVTKEEVSHHIAQNDSILSRVKAFLLTEEKVDFNRISSRKIANKSNFWKRYKKVLETQTTITEDLITELTSKSKVVNSTLKLWSNTKLMLESVYKDSLYNTAINDVVVQADSLNRIILARKNVFFTSLKLLRKTSVRVDKLLQKINSVKRFRQEHMFEKTNQSFFSIAFFERSNWELSQYLRSFIDANTEVLKRFYRNYKTQVVSFFIYIVILIGVFVFLMIKSKNVDKTKADFYKKTVIAVLRRPISLAVILGIFSSGLLFYERPPILSDLFILVSTIAIADIVAHISNKKGKIFIIAFVLMIVLRFVNYIFPPITVFHRIDLLLMGIVEVVVFMMLYRKLNIKHIIGKLFNQFVHLIIISHILASVVGIIANFTGHLRFAEIAIDLSITNTLVGLILIIFSVVFIGLLRIAIDGTTLKKLHFIRNRAEYLKKKATVIILVGVSLLWFNYILQILRIDETVYQFFSSIINTNISVGNTAFTMGSVFLFFFIIWLSVIVADMIKAILEDDVLTLISLKKGVPRIISAVVRFSLITIGFLLAVSAIGIPLDQLTIIISAFSVGIGFGLQNVVNNFVSGIILLFERPVQIGDTVEVNNIIGKVKSMGIRSSNVRTFNGAEVIVPNANLISNEVVNWTLSDNKRRIEIFSGVAYGSDVHLVKEILLDILNRHPDVLQEPQPLVLFNDLGESSLDFRLLFWTEQNDRRLVIKSEVIFKIYEALNEAKIEIPFPQRDLHIKTKGKD